MEGVLGSGISKWNVNWATLPADEKGHGRCFKQMERVLGGATST